MNIVSLARVSGEKSRVLTDSEISQIGGGDTKHTERRVCGNEPTSPIDPAGLDIDF